MATRFLRWLRARVQGWPAYALPALVAVTGVVATLAAAAAIETGRMARAQIRFDARVDQANESVEGRLDTYVAMLHAGAGLFAADPDVTLGEFRAFVDHLQLRDRYTGIQGLGFSAVVAPATRREIDARLAAQGGPPAIAAPGPGAGQVHAVLYLEPQDQRNQRALGFDMYASQPRREAMDRARDSGQPALSGRVELVQEQGRDRQSGFLIYEPIYRGGRIPTSVEERRAALVGFVYAPFRAGDLLRAVLYSAASEGLDYAVYDGEPGSDTLLHQSASQTASGGQAVAVRSLDIAGRPWVIVYRAQKDFEQAADGRVTLLFGVGGLLATLLLTLAAWRQGQARLRAEREVAARIAIEARQKLLLDELNHRVKNTLATVQSIAAQSLRKDRDLERVRQAFEARLVALSQAHNLLTRDNWTGANLAELLDCELAPYADAESDRVALHGEPVWLTRPMSPWPWASRSTNWRRTP